MYQDGWPSPVSDMCSHIFVSGTGRISGRFACRAESHARSLFLLTLLTIISPSIIVPPFLNYTKLPPHSRHMSPRRLKEITPMVKTDFLNYLPAGGPKVDVWHGRNDLFVI